MPKSHTSTLECYNLHMQVKISEQVLETEELLITEFNHCLDVNYSLSGRLKDELYSLSKSLQPALLSKVARKRKLLGLIRAKYRLNQASMKRFLDFSATKKIYFNYPERVRLQKFFDLSDGTGLREWLLNKKAMVRHIETLISHFEPVSERETLQSLHAELSTSDSRDEMLEALFSGYVFLSFNTANVHKLFNAEANEAYLDNFFEHLVHFYPASVKREHALTLTKIDEELIDQFDSIQNFKDALFSHIKAVHQKLTNHCFFATIIDLPRQKQGLKWELVSAITLYAEKFIESELSKSYFRPGKIESETASYIKELDVAGAKFSIANEGFYFRDCFILPSQDWKDAGSYIGPYKLLLLFQKNERDETLIPCPACRSKNVRGNSYPALGIRSWECMNTFCPDKSKFNRGKRYSLSSLINQEATDREENQIPLRSVRDWKLDVKPIGDDSEIVEMLLLHYTLHGDSSDLINISVPSHDCFKHGRSIVSEAFPASGAGEYDKFFGSSYFAKFQILKTNQPESKKLENLFSNENLVIHKGDAFSVLQAYPDNYFDGCVTSPPYYNARSYAQWPNIYTYLYDMYNVAHQIFRTLKPGKPFLFNIFDYFDNENNIVFSAMGKKRMVLGAYTSHLFRTLGFQLLGNVIWYKGEIEGKRNFNQGNMSPYYQTPLNCYEHVFVFSKGQPDFDVSELPSILPQKPVMKMIRGENRYGHTAPYPKEIPELLLKLMDARAVILDPFSGSMTTGRTAYKRGLKSVNIEVHQDYCDLGIRLLMDEKKQVPLF